MEESDNQEDNEIACTSSTSADDRIPLLHYEQDLMLDTFVEDVVFILARGLGMERLFLNHLHLYSDRRFTVFVLNTLPDDEHYFLERLKQLNPKCPPKVITSEVLVRDRELVYKTGGVQFVTSRILMVDLLTNKVPIDRIAGILVYRAHELLNSYQESFILRLFREKKSGGFVKAFTDNATAIAGGGIGQLQRLIDRLYVKRVRIVPRFDAVVKESFDVNPVPLPLYFLIACLF
jgi:DNA excision repair protein ERCC-4